MLFRILLHHALLLIDPIFKIQFHPPFGPVKHRFSTQDSGYLMMLCIMNTFVCIHISNEYIF